MEIGGRQADLSRAGNHAAVAPLFAAKFGRLPLAPGDPAATINDLIFARMIASEWTPLQRRMVDKITAKEEAARLVPGIRIARTLVTIEMDEVPTPGALHARLRPFIGTDAIANPAQASGGAIFLREVVGPDALADLHALASRDYSLVMREMQYAGLPRRVIVEALVPTADGEPPDDFKFHCVHGKPLVCQIDHARFGHSWGRLFRLPDFAPMDPADGLVTPPGVMMPSPAQLAAMMDIAARLSEPFDYVRVDLYDGLDGITFGELTFTPAASLGIAPSKHGSHRETDTHRLFSRIVIEALRAGRSGRVAERER